MLKTVTQLHKHLLVAVNLLLRSETDAENSLFARV